MAVSSEDDTDGAKEFPYNASSLDDTEGDTTTEADEPDGDSIDHNQPGFGQEVFEDNKGPDGGDPRHGGPSVGVLTSAGDHDEAEDRDLRQFFNDGDATQYLSVPRSGLATTPTVPSVLVQVQVNTSVDTESPVNPEPGLARNRKQFRDIPHGGQSEPLPMIEENEKSTKRKSRIPSSSITYRQTENESIERPKITANVDQSMPKPRFRPSSELVYNAEGEEAYENLDLDDEFLYTEYREGLAGGSRENHRYGYKENAKNAEDQGPDSLRQQVGREGGERKEWAKVQLEREYKKLREREGHSEWVCLDLGNDYAFQSFLRIIHQHAPHPVHSSFMDRYTDGKFKDNPPSPQAWATSLDSSQLSNASASTTSSFNSVPASLSTDSLSHTDPPAAIERVRSTSASSIRSESEQEAVNLMSTFASETLAPFPGAVDPQFMYPARIFATPPYPEWRINILRRAQCAGMGDIGRPMEMVLWGREDPVIANASGALRELQRLGKSWGPGTGKRVAGRVGGRKGKRKDPLESPGFAAATNRGWDWENGEVIEDSVSGSATIGQSTVGSQGTIKGVQVTQTKQRKNGGRTRRGKRTADERSIVEDKLSHSSGESWHESSDEGTVELKSPSYTPKSSSPSSSHHIRMSSKMPFKFTEWSDEEDEHASELEWQAWHMDIRRHGKRQYAMRARREAGIGWEGSGSLGRMGWPKDPEDDMKRFMDRKRKLEPSGDIIISSTGKQRNQSLNPSLRRHQAQRTLVRSVSGTASMRTKASSTVPMTLPVTPPRQRTIEPVTTDNFRVDVASTTHTHTDVVDWDFDKQLASQLETQLPPVLHHSTSMHADMGFRRCPQELPARRPSMPALISDSPYNANANSIPSASKDKGKATDKSLWFGGEENTPKSPTSITGSSWFFPRKFDREKDKDKDSLLLNNDSTMHSGEASSNANLSRSASALVTGRTGSISRKKESGDVHTIEGNMTKAQRPQLRVATTSFPSSSHVATTAKPSMKSPTSPTGFGTGRTKRMRSDASLLSVMAGGEHISITKDIHAQEAVSTSVQSDEQQQERRKKRGAVEKMLNTALDFVEGR